MAKDVLTRDQVLGLLINPEDPDPDQPFPSGADFIEAVVGHFGLDRADYAQYIEQHTPTVAEEPRYARVTMRSDIAWEVDLHEGRVARVFVSVHTDDEGPETETLYHEDDELDHELDLDVHQEAAREAVQIVIAQDYPEPPTYEVPA